MDKMMQECFKPHPLLHTLGGVGLGLIVAALWPDLATVTVGVVVFAVAIVGEFMVMKK
ncbi:hypothetical protein HYW55_00915 [Candidatus Gottesmanbacteria bacterium]|nr:hypothetical protein [Candidatus Gottesmanbacteria bacterium]